MKKLAKDLNIKIDYIIPNVDINDNMILIIGYESDNGSGEMVVKTVKESPNSIICRKYKSKCT